MDRLHVQRMAQDKVDALFLAQIRDPIPAVHAFNTDDKIITEGFKRGQQLFRPGFDFLVQKDFTLLVDDADIKGAGVQIDSTIMAVGAMEEVHESSPL